MRNARLMIQDVLDVVIDSVLWGLSKTVVLMGEWFMKR